MVELPAVLAEGGVPVEPVVVEGPDGLEGDRLPSVVVEGPAPEHLEVLRRAVGRGVGASRGEHGGEADAVDRGLGHVLDGGGKLDAGQLQHGGEDVDGVGELPAHPTAWTRAGPWPAHDAGIGHPALVDLALPSLEGGVARHGPAPGVVVVGGRAAQLVDAPFQFGRARRVDVLQPVVVDRPAHATLRAGPVVRHQDDQGVLAVADPVQEVEHPGQLGIGIGQETGEALHEPGRHPLLVGRQVVPSPAPMKAVGPSRSRAPTDPTRAGGRRYPPATGPNPCRTVRGSARSTRRVRGGANGRRRCRDRGRTGGPRPRRGDRPVGRWPGRPGRRSGGIPPRSTSVAGSSDCRGRAQVRTGGSHPRGTRTSGRIPGPAASCGAGRPCWSRRRARGATSPPRRWHSPAGAGSRTGSRSPWEPRRCIPESPWPGRPTLERPFQVMVCARSAGRPGWVSTARWCGSWPAAPRFPPTRRWSGCRCRTRSTRVARIPRRRGRPAPRWAHPSGGVGTSGHPGEESRQSSPMTPSQSGVSISTSCSRSGARPACAVGRN